MIRTRGWRLPAVLGALFLVGVLAPAPAGAQPPSFDGRVVGQFTANGQPVPNVQVTLYDAVTRQYQGAATTDATGSYAVARLDVARTYRIEFVTPDFVRQWAHHRTSFETADAFAVAAGQDTVVDETALPTGTLVITAVDKVTGAPVPQFYSEAVGESGGRSGNTETGSLTLTNVLPGDYSVVVYPDDLHFSTNTTSTVVADRTTEVELRLDPAAALETTLVDAATNAPVADACIQPVAELDVLGLYLHNCSGPDGRVRAGRLTGGSYRIFAKPADGVHGAQWVGANRGTGSRYLATVVEATPGQVTAVPPIRLDLAGSIAGTVTDAATGRPVPSMCAFPHATGTGAGPEPGPHCSDAQGHYTIGGLGPYHWPVEFVGDYTNEAYAWQWSGGRPNQLVAQPTRVRVGWTSTVDARLAAGATVRGRVLTADGTPATGHVEVVNALTGDPATVHAFTDENGYYELRSLAGQFVRIRFTTAYPDERTFWYRDASGFHTATPVWVPSGGATTGIDLTIPNA